MEDFGMEVKEDLGRRLRGATASLSKWKQRVAEKQDLIRYLRVRVRDLEESREFWKRRATTVKQTCDPLPSDCVDSVDTEPLAADPECLTTLSPAVLPPAAVAPVNGSPSGEA
jgi:hypothetical protein